MKVYSLTGKSGTGKSYRAQAVCEQHGIECMIDDGLLIYRDRVVAGTSAKRESTRIGAIRTALFARADKAAAAAEVIRKLKPSGLLVLGTSDRMADLICGRLGIPCAEERIYIEDISTPEEREAAERQRNAEGKHVIPVPTMQLKRDFAGYFLDPMKIIRGARGLYNSLFGSCKDPGRTVVRPQFSYNGAFVVSDSVVNDIAYCLGHRMPGIAMVDSVYENTSPENLMISAVITLERGVPVLKTAKAYQAELKKAVEEMTAFNVVRTDIEVRSIEG